MISCYAIFIEIILNKDVDSNVKKTVLIALKACLLILFATTSAIGQDNTIKACFTEWFPYSYTKDGQPFGFSIDIYTKAVRKSAMEISYEMKPWARCEFEFLSGKFDAIVDGDDSIPNSLNVRQRAIPWVITLWVQEDSSVQEFSGYSQFDNQDIGYVRGYTYPSEFLGYVGFKNKYTDTYDLQGLKMLQGGRYGAFIRGIVNSTHLVKK